MSSDSKGTGWIPGAHSMSWKAVEKDRMRRHGELSASAAPPRKTGGSRRDHNVVHPTACANATGGQDNLTRRAFSS